MTTNRLENVDPVTVYDLNQALQSNFRVIALLTDQSSSLGALFLQLKGFADAQSDLGMTKIVDEMAHKLFQVLMQANYTGRCLNGVLNANASVSTDQRGEADRVYEFLRKAVSAEKPVIRISEKSKSIN